MRESFIRRVKDVRGRAVGFRVDRVRLPNGKVGSREYLDHPGAVAVVPLLPGGKVLLVRQHRYAVGEDTWEIPAGKLDKGERPAACAARELEEETGYRAGRLTKLLSFWPTPAFANEIIHIFLAENLRKGRAQPDEDEFIEEKSWPLAKLRAAIRAGKIRDSKTLIGIMALSNVSLRGRAERRRSNLKNRAP